MGMLQQLGTSANFILIRMARNNAFQSGEYMLENELKARPYAVSENVVVYVSDLECLKRLHFDCTMGLMLKARRMVG